MVTVCINVNQLQVRGGRGAGMNIDVVSLDQLARRINSAHSNFEKTFRLSLEHAKEAGGLLMQAKRKVGHGNWEAWLSNNCQVSISMSQKYMRISREWTAIEAAKEERVTYLSIKGALKLLAKPRKDRPAPMVIDGGVQTGRLDIAPSAPAPRDEATLSDMTVDDLIAHLTTRVRRLGQNERNQALVKLECCLKQLKDRSVPAGFMTLAEINRRFFRDIVSDADLSMTLDELGKVEGMGAVDWVDLRGITVRVYPEVVAAKLQSIAVANDWPGHSLGSAYERHVKIGAGLAWP